MVGCRVDHTEPHDFDPGDYGIWSSDRVWYAHCPGPGELIANLSEHDVTEHEDGSISVYPSIRCSDGQRQWHGFLENGVWRECS